MTFVHDHDVFTPYSDGPVQITDEKVRWRARQATFIAGRWAALCKRMPRFVLEEFRAIQSGPANPHMRAVVRLPTNITEQPIPVGVVSKNYQLAQHADVVEMCFKALRAHQIDPAGLDCEVGLTPLGEWMNFRAYFPDNFSYAPNDRYKLRLRLECFNSVEGSSQLVILLGWFRFICSNGLIVGETKAAVRDIHDANLNLDAIPEIISNGLAKVSADLNQLRDWESSLIEWSIFEDWVNDHLARQWGKKAACRILHICRSGTDVRLMDPFAGGKPSEKRIKEPMRVPGAPKPAKNFYDVSQALSWIATQRASADERLKWQVHIPQLIDSLRRQLIRGAVRPSK